MTSVFSAEGKNIPCTVIEAGPCVVTQVKTPEKDGYAAVQLAYDEALKDYIGDIRSFCVSRGADFITVSSSEPIERAIFGRLLNVGIIE